jgi:endonuclease/exonuclease/phosphatase family metal-dependent hydrolase
MREAMPSRHAGCLFLILSAAFLTPSLLGCAPPEEPPSVDVLTFNLRHNVDCWEERMELIADGIAALAPAVIGLQEIEQAVEQGEILDEMLIERGLDYELRQASKSGVAGDLSGEGIGIMSLLPLEDVRSLDLEEGRVAIYARARLADDTSLDIVNTHLSAAADQGDVRTRQMDAVLALAGEHEGARATVLLGDMNSDPEDESIARALAAGYRDAWEGFGSDEPAGFTSGIDLQAAKTGTAQAADRRIDYVLLSESDMRFADTAVVLDEPAASGLWPSDHLGVWARLSALPDEG